MIHPLQEQVSLANSDYSIGMKDNTENENAIVRPTPSAATELEADNKEEMIPQCCDLSIGLERGFHHQAGNMRFRLLVDLYAEEYDTIPMVENDRKMDVAKKIVDDLAKMIPPTLFVQQARNNQHGDSFRCVPFNEAVNETYQALQYHILRNPVSRSETLNRLFLLNEELAHQYFIMGHVAFEASSIMMPLTDDDREDKLQDIVQRNAPAPSISSLSAEPFIASPLTQASTLKQDIVAPNTTALCIASVASKPSSSSRPAQFSALKYNLAAQPSDETAEVVSVVLADPRDMQEWQGKKRRRNNLVIREEEEESGLLLPNSAPCQRWVERYEGEYLASSGDQKRRTAEMMTHKTTSTNPPSHLVQLNSDDGICAGVPTHLAVEAVPLQDKKWAPSRETGDIQTDVATSMSLQSCDAAVPPGNDRCQPLVKLHRDQQHSSTSRYQKSPLVETGADELTMINPPARLVQTTDNHGASPLDVAIKIADVTIKTTLQELREWELLYRTEALPALVMINFELAKECEKGDGAVFEISSKPNSAAVPNQVPNKKDSSIKTNLALTRKPLPTTTGLKQKRPTPCSQQERKQQSMPMGGHDRQLSLTWKAQGSEAVPRMSTAHKLCETAAVSTENTDCSKSLEVKVPQLSETPIVAFHPTRIASTRSLKQQDLAFQALKEQERVTIVGPAPNGLMHNSQADEKWKAVVKPKGTAMKLQCCDVLLGCGSEVSRHPGNERFGLLTTVFAEEYSKLANDQMKSTYAQKFVTNLANMIPPGRFVVLVGTDNCVCAPFHVAAEATLQALQVTSQYRLCKTEALTALVVLNLKLANEYNKQFTTISNNLLE
jgi:hypothetical protein